MLLIAAHQVGLFWVKRGLIAVYELQLIRVRSVYLGAHHKPSRRRSRLHMKDENNFRSIKEEKGESVGSSTRSGNSWSRSPESE